MKVNIKGRPFEVAPEPADVWGWIETRNWEGTVFDAMRANLKPEMTFVDLGAWIGTHTLYAYGLAGRLISVEPDPVAFKILAENVALNSIPAELSQTAIADRNGTVEIGSSFLGASTTRINLEGGGGIGAAVPEHTVEVPSRTLESFITEHQVEKPFIKIDVEGAEEQILASSMDWILANKPTMIIELHAWWWKNPQEMNARLDALRKAYKQSYGLPRSLSHIFTE